MQTLRQDIRYGIRTLRRNPGFAIIAVLTLALGIGANTAIFSVFHGVLLKPLPYPEAERMVWVWGTRPNSQYATFSDPDFLEHRHGNSSFSELVAFPSGTRSFNLTGGDRPERVLGLPVSEGFFRVFAVPPLLGRTFQLEEYEYGNHRVVVLSEGFWKRYFGGDPGVLAETLRLDGEVYKVVGVVPREGQYRAWAELWVPHALTERQKTVRGSNYLHLVGRLKPGVSLAQAESDLKAIAASIDHLHSTPGYSVRLEAFNEREVGFVRPTLLVLLASVGVLLLIACANIANLMMVRAAGREKEVAIRAALGASLLRLSQQFWAESMLVAVAGGLLGWGVARGGLELLRTFNPGNLPRLADVYLDTTVFLFAAVLVVATSFVFGLAPAIYFAGADLNRPLREGGRRSQGSGGATGFRRVMVVAEVALSVVLLVAASLLVQSLYRLQNTDPGFNPADVLTVRMNLPSSRYGELASRSAFYRDLLTRTDQLPGVTSAALVNNLPLIGSNTNCRLWAPDKAGWNPDAFPPVEIVSVSPGYFAAMEIPLLQGRSFRENEISTTRLFQQGATGRAPRAGIINRGMAETIWPGESALGKRVQWCLEGEAGLEFLIVGVAADVKQFGLGERARPTLYFPTLLPSVMSLVVRTEGDPARLTSQIRAEVAALDPDLPIFAVRTMVEALRQSTARPRFSALLIGTFASLALIMAVVGLYGVISYMVSQRTHEIGIRMALGARPRDVLRLVLGQGMALILVGVVIGIAAAYSLSHYLESLLFGVTANDPATFAIVSITLAGVAAIACLIPARRAMRVDPMVALRYE